MFLIHIEACPQIAHDKFKKRSQAVSRAEPHIGRKFHMAALVAVHDFEGLMDVEDCDLGWSGCTLLYNLQIVQGECQWLFLRVHATFFSPLSESSIL